MQGALVDTFPAFLEWGGQVRGQSLEKQIEGWVVLQR